VSDRLIQELVAHGTTDRRLGSGRPKSVRTTDNIAVVHAGLDLQSAAEVTRSVLCDVAPPIVVHFNYVKSTCKSICYKLTLLA